MRIFILEDNLRRMDYFTKHLLDVDTEIVHSERADQAIDYLKEGYKDYNLFLLDHDLGGEAYVSIDNQNTGSQVAKFMSSLDDNFSHTIIHSFNHAGGINMKRLLPGSIYMPNILSDPDLLIRLIKERVR